MLRVMEIRRDFARSIADMANLAIFEIILLLNCIMIFELCWISRCKGCGGLSLDEFRRRGH